MPSIILIRGAGDLASGVAVRLLKSGLRVAMSELPAPLAIRRSVSFAEAIYEGEMTVEGIVGRCIKDPQDTLSILSVFGKQQIPIMVDPDCLAAQTLRPAVIVDARMTKRPPESIGFSPVLYIGLGPGFIAGQNCQAVIETRRGHTMGRVYFQGASQMDTGLPEGDPARVLRAPVAGFFVGRVDIGSHVDQGQVVAEIFSSSQDVGQSSLASVVSPFKGVLRGLFRSGLTVTAGMKVGDVDPRDDPLACTMVSDKALAVGGGVLEAILARPELRLQLWA